MDAEAARLLWLAAVGTVVAGLLFSGLWRVRFGKSAETKKAARNTSAVALASLLFSQVDFLIGIAILFAVAVEALGPIAGLRICAAPTSRPSRFSSILARSAWGAVFLGTGVLYLATGAVRFSTLGASLVRAPSETAPIATVGLWLFIGGLALGLLPHLGASSHRFHQMRSNSLAFVIGPVRVFALIGLFRILSVTVDLAWLARIERIGACLLIFAVASALVVSDIRKRVALFGVMQSAILLFALGDLGDAGSSEELSAVINLGALHLGVSLSIAYAALGPLLRADRGLRADSINGRATVAPLAALAFSAALLSLAALPPGGGFRIALESSLRAIDRGAPGLALLIVIGQGTLACLGLALVQGLYSSRGDGGPNPAVLDQPGRDPSEGGRAPLLWLFAPALLVAISFIPTALLAQ